MTWRRPSIAVAVALLSAMAGGMARAQDADPASPEVISPEAVSPEAASPEPTWPAPATREPDLPTFPVLIRGDAPGVSVQLVGSDRAGIPCGERCTLELPVGRYRVVVTAPSGRSSTQYLQVSMPSQVLVTPQNKAARNTGFVFMGLGVGGIGVGASLLAVWAYWRMVLGFSCGEGGSPCDESDQVPRWMLPTGLVSLGAGLAFGATGLTLWRKNAHAVVTVRPLRSGLALGGSF